MISVNDAALLRGDFHRGEFPKGKEYLAKHFTSEVERSLVSYYAIFPSLAEAKSQRGFVRCFIDHTGHYCSLSHAMEVFRKAKKVEKAVAAAESSGDLERLADLKSGKPV